jgi:hypothetical protein
MAIRPYRGLALGGKVAKFARHIAPSPERGTSHGTLYSCVEVANVMASEYELIRLRNVERNKELLRQLGISVAEVRSSS